jgi:hypothetical protein
MVIKPGDVCIIHNPRLAYLPDNWEGHEVTVLYEGVRHQRDSERIWFIKNVITGFGPYSVYEHMLEVKRGPW